MREQIRLRLRRSRQTDEGFGMSAFAKSPSGTDECMDVHDWLSNYPGVKSQFEFVVISLRRKEISGALPCAKATVEVLRTALGNCRYNSTSHMMSCTRAIGKELSAAVSACLDFCQPAATTTTTTTSTPPLSV